MRPTLRNYKIKENSVSPDRQDKKKLVEKHKIKHLCEASFARLDSRDMLLLLLLFLYVKLQLLLLSAVVFVILSRCTLTPSKMLRVLTCQNTFSCHSLFGCSLCGCDNYFFTGCGGGGTFGSRGG